MYQKYALVYALLLYMARNQLAGTGTSLKKLSPQARKRKLAYDKKFQKRPEQVKKRVECNGANRKAGTYGNGDKMDMSHCKSGKLVKESQKANRARNGQSGKSTLKAA